MGMEWLWRLRSMVSTYGVQMGGKRDLFAVFGWNPKPVHSDFVAKYKNQDIARRVVLAPVNALWSDPPKIVGDDAFEKAWKDLLASQPVFFHLQRLDKLCRLGRFAIMVIGFDDGAKLEQPVTQKAGRKVLYFQPYAEGSVSIAKWDENQQSARFGLPEIYQVDPGKFDPLDNNTGIARSLATRATSTSFKVHWTRVLHVAEDTLESTVFGESALKSCYNTLDDILKVTGGSAETYWLAANRGLHVDVDKEVELDESSQEALSEEVEEYQNELRRVLRTRGVKVASLGSDVSDPRGTFDVQLSLLASNTGIPKRVLAGSEAGQLASQQDRANWAQRVQERTTEYGEPIVLLPFIRLLIGAGVLPQPSVMTIEWPDAFKMNPLERAQTSAQMARSAANVAKTLATVDKMNIEWATAAQPQIIPMGGGGFFGNTHDRWEALQAMAEKMSPKKPEEGGEPAPMEERPPIVDKREPIELLTVEEGRAIIGFGKHQPVFDEPSDTDRVKPRGGPENPGANG